jgi:hypothetical protein
VEFTNEGANLRVTGDVYWFDQNGTSPYPQNCDEDGICHNRRVHGHDPVRTRIPPDGFKGFAVGGPLLNGQDQIRIGGLPQGNVFFGLVDEFAMYDYILTDEQIEAHFLAGLEVLRGDMDCDGDVDFDDIDPFVLGLNNAAQYELDFGLPPEAKGDMDGDGDFDFDDIDGFVAALQGGVESVPEPGTLWMTLVMLGGLGVWGVAGRRRRR